MKYPVLKSVNFLVEVKLAKLALANLTSTKRFTLFKTGYFIENSSKKLFNV